MLSQYYGPKFKMITLCGAVGNDYSCHFTQSIPFLKYGRFDGPLTFWVIALSSIAECPLD